MTEEEKIANRFKRFGVTQTIVNELVQSGLAKGFNREVSLIGVRFALSTAFDTEEYFSSEEVGLMTGLSPEEAKRVMIASGCNYMTVQPAPWLH